MVDKIEYKRVFKLRKEIIEIMDTLYPLNAPHRVKISTKHNEDGLNLRLMQPPLHNICCSSQR